LEYADEATWPGPWKAVERSVRNRRRGHALGDLFLFAEDEERLARCWDGLRGRQGARRIPCRSERAIDRSVRGQGGLDTTALASLVAGSIAATGSLARLIGERAFSGLFHEGERSHLYITVLGTVDPRGVLRSYLVRRSRPVSGETRERGDRPGLRGDHPARGGIPVEIAQITDEDIENLLSS